MARRPKAATAAGELLVVKSVRVLVACSMCHRATMARVVTAAVQNLCAAQWISLPLGWWLQMGATINELYCGHCVRCPRCLRFQEAHSPEDHKHTPNGAEAPEPEPVPGTNSDSPKLPQ